MKKSAVSVSCASLAALLMSVALLSLRAVVSADEKSQTEAQAESSARKKPAGRLPDYFEKIGIGQSQREKIYGIQAKYKDEIEKLQSQLEAVETKRDAEIHALLTDRQKKEYAQLVDEARKRREENNKVKSDSP